MEEAEAEKLYEREILELPGRQTLAIGVVRALSHRSDVRGLARIAGHFAVMAGGGFLVWRALDRWWLLVPAMMLHGATIVTMFAPMHECVHKTAFKSPWLNDTVGWIAGSLAFYNFTFYRRFHTWHHRYTQEPERDPELAERRPRSLAGFLWHLSGLPFWLGRTRGLAELAWSSMDDLDYIPPHARRAIAWSVRAQLGLYALVAAVSVGIGSTAVLWFWFLPAVLAQPLLRAVLIVEHTGCTHDTNGLTNTRTTLASRPMRFLMWNMPFHAEHHLYPSIPFFRLPEAHAHLQSALAHIAPGYPAANVEVIGKLRCVMTKYDVVG